MKHYVAEGMRQVMPWLQIIHFNFPKILWKAMMPKCKEKKQTVTMSPSSCCTRNLNTFMRWMFENFHYLFIGFFFFLSKSFFTSKLESNKDAWGTKNSSFKKKKSKFNQFHKLENDIHYINEIIIIIILFWISLHYKFFST